MPTEGNSEIQALALCSICVIHAVCCREWGHPAASWIGQRLIAGSDVSWELCRMKNAPYTWKIGKTLFID